MVTDVGTWWLLNQVPYRFWMLSFNNIFETTVIFKYLTQISLRLQVIFNLFHHMELKLSKHTIRFWTIDKAAQPVEADANISHSFINKTPRKPSCRPFIAHQCAMKITG